MSTKALEYLHQVECLIKQAKKLSSDIITGIDYRDIKYKNISEQQNKLVAGKIYLEGAIEEVKSQRTMQFIREGVLHIMLWTIIIWVIWIRLHAK